MSAPLDEYAPRRRAGDHVYFAGITAVDRHSQRVINSYLDLPEEDRVRAGYTCQLSVDS
jgi:hypothetical protein